MAIVHSGMIGVVPPVANCDLIEKERLGCEKPTQRIVGGVKIDYPILQSEFLGDEVLIYRHPYFFISDSVWAWFEEYSYYKSVTDTTPYRDRDPRYMQAVRVYENELARRTKK